MNVVDCYWVKVIQKIMAEFHFEREVYYSYSSVPLVAMPMAFSMTLTTTMTMVVSTISTSVVWGVATLWRTMVSSPPEWWSLSPGGQAPGPLVPLGMFLLIYFIPWGVTTT